MAPIEHVADKAVPMSFQMGEEGSSYNWNSLKFWLVIVLFILLSKMVTWITLFLSTAKEIHLVELNSYFKKYRNI